jgi:hypothetical protein
LRDLAELPQQLPAGFLKRLEVPRDSAKLVGPRCAPAPPLVHQLAYVADDGAHRPRVNPKNASGSAMIAPAAMSALRSEATMAASAILIVTAGSTIRAAARAAAIALTSAKNFATGATNPMGVR